MSASAHDLELTPQIQFVRAQKAEQKANDISSPSTCSSTAVLRDSTWR